MGLVHGRLAASEQQQVLHAFGAGLISVLVSTTVVEVGIDVPKAKLMIIDSAER